MKTNHEHFINNKNHNGQSGNALIYVLIAIALFAALSFTLGRQTDTGEAGGVSDQKAELIATQIISYAVQAKSSIDQMMFTGSTIDDLDFVRPTNATFNTAPHIHKVHHPQGGGLNPGRLPAEAIVQTTTDPVAGWYMGAFDNVEWSNSNATDVILVAYQISKKVCEKINMKITGNVTIPIMDDSIKETMIDDVFHSGVNLELTTDPAGTPICAECHKQSSLCVENQAQDAYGFYTIIADR